MTSNYSHVTRMKNSDCGEFEQCNYMQKSFFLDFAFCTLFRGRVTREKSVLINDNSDFSNHVINVNCMKWE